MYTSRFAAAALFLFASFAHAEATNPPAKFVPPWGGDVFPISFWAGPPAKFLTPERFKQMADAGFTVAMPSTFDASPAANQKALDAAQAAGIKTFIMDGRIGQSADSTARQKELDAVIADYAHHPAFAGYFLADEPAPGAYPGLKQVGDYFREKDPVHPAYVNLFPNYVPTGWIGMSYEQYVESFVETCHPFVVSYDHYHFTNQGDRGGFFENLATVRAVSLKHHLPFWNIVLSVPHAGYRPLTEAEKRFEAMQTLAFGGQGLLWFTYWQPAPGWGDAIINLDGKPTRQYEEITRINHDVQAFGRILLKATSTAVCCDNDKTMADLPVHCDNKQVTVGLFAGEDDQRYVLLASRDYRRMQTVSLEVASRGRPVERFFATTGRWRPVDADQMRHIVLDKAGAALFRWQAGQK